ncbi:hypothetical protein R1sor_014824 [Riccia sorocarpa]|uniref:DUF4218 domain-containing protein n=1 Tax=Riccia sorocarpa TaxID=122646 RepID=A0ABD3HAH9_9MARC
MTWHKEHRSDDGVMRLVVDSHAVRHVEQTWPEFGRDPRHLRFGLASDGVSPYGVKSLSHSTWPVVLTNYNVPPWLASKKGFLLLSLFRDLRKSRTSTFISSLWLRNFSNYGLEWMMSMMVVRNELDGIGHIPIERARLKRWSILHRLPYWKDLLIQHLLDPMHIEANVTKSLIKRIFGEKDGKPARRACEEFGVHPEAWIQVSDGGIESLPSAPWILTTEERKICRQRISDIRFPTSFGSCLREAFEKDGAKWHAALKSHDYHILLQYVLPIVLQGLGSQDLRDAIYDLSALMRWVCSKTVRTTDIDEKELFAITTLCKLERTLPPDYFDSQIHVLVHLVREVSLLWTSSRQMDDLARTYVVEEDHSGSILYETSCVRRSFNPKP